MYFCILFTQSSGALFTMLTKGKSYLRENPIFCKKIDLKITHLKNFFNIFFDICHCNSGLAFKSKNYYISLLNYFYFLKENSQNLSQNTSELCE
jgi:hypothetical protein